MHATFRFEYPDIFRCIGVEGIDSASPVTVRRVDSLVRVSWVVDTRVFQILLDMGLDVYIYTKESREEDATIVVHTIGTRLEVASVSRVLRQYVPAGEGVGCEVNLASILNALQFLRMNLVIMHKQD